MKGGGATEACIRVAWRHRLGVARLIRVSESLACAGTRVRGAGTVQAPTATKPRGSAPSTGAACPSRFSESISEVLSASLHAHRLELSESPSGSFLHLISGLPGLSRLSESLCHSSESLMPVICLSRSASRHSRSVERSPFFPLFLQPRPPLPSPSSLSLPSLPRSLPLFSLAPPLSLCRDAHHVPLWIKLCIHPVDAPPRLTCPSRRLPSHAH